MKKDYKSTFDSWLDKNREEVFKKYEKSNKESSFFEFARCMFKNSGIKCESINPVSLVLAARVKTFNQNEINIITSEIDGLEDKSKESIIKVIDDHGMGFHGTKDSLIASIMKALGIKEDGGMMTTATVGGQFAAPLVDTVGGVATFKRKYKSYDESFLSKMEKVINEDTDSNLVINWITSSPSSVAYYKKIGLNGKKYEEASIDTPDGNEISYVKMDGKRYIVDYDNDNYSLDEAFTQFKCANCGYCSTNQGEFSQQDDVKECPRCHHKQVRKFIREDKPKK
jgi:DNA-directed RNA polymerase subunit RPC12/RpoP